MTDVLEQFVKTLDIDLQNKVQGMKNRRVLETLKKDNIDVPQDVLDELEERRRLVRSHKSVMASMECFRGNKLSDIGLEV